jgi:hypothetical protein
VAPDNTAYLRLQLVGRVAEPHRRGVGSGGDEWLSEAVP